MKVWQFILDHLNSDQPVALLFVLDSQGSSPGRQGFKMAVATNGEICGTIGGGIMEHKLVEHAKSYLEKGGTDIILKPQFHDKESGTNRSGMICSGYQYVATIVLQPSRKNLITKILQTEIDQSQGYFNITPTSFEFSEKSFSKEKMDKIFECQNEQEWSYSERIDATPVVHIIGGGHVGLAVSQVMSLLGFYIKIYDNRSNLNTMEQNHFAHEKHLITYEKINEQMIFEEGDFVAIMTFGYQTDKAVLKCLLDKKFAYLGCMGSASKMKDLLNELEAEGFSREKLNQIHTPIGLNIFSKTTMEIGISVAAEIIREKNLPAKQANKKLSTEKTGH